MNRLEWFGLVSGALLAALPAQAQQMAPQQEWSVQTYPDRCTAVQTYGKPGQADLIIHERPGEPLVFTVSDARWNVESADVPYVRFQLDGQAVAGTIYAMPPPDNELPGYAIMVTGPLHARFAAARSLRVYRRDALIADLSLAGIGPAMQKMTACLAADR